MVGSREKSWPIHSHMFASMSGIKIEAIENVTTAQELQLAAEWELTKPKFKMTRMELQGSC